MIIKVKYHLRRGEAVLISYDPLWQTMEERGVSTYTLINDYNINPRTINNLKHNKSVTAYTLEKLCKILDCKVEDVITILPDTAE